MLLCEQISHVTPPTLPDRQSGIHVYYPKDLWRTQTFFAPQWRTDDPYETVGAHWRGFF